MHVFSCNNSIITFLSIVKITFWLTLFHNKTLLTPLLQMPLENNVTNEIYHNEQILFLPQCIQLFSVKFILAFQEIFHIFHGMFSKLSAADLLYVYLNIVANEKCVIFSNSPAFTIMFSTLFKFTLIYLQVFLIFA